MVAVQSVMNSVWKLTFCSTTPSLDDLQRGSTLLAKLITDGGQLLTPVTVQHFRDLCDSFLLPHVEELTISPLRRPTDFGSTEQAQ